MPTVKRFDRFQIMIYLQDHNPPHVHLVARAYRAQVRIADGLVMRGSAPAAEVAQARAWIAANRAMLTARFIELQRS